MSYCIS